MDLGADLVARAPVSGRRAIVLGGGVAGIAAAFALRDRGYRTTLCEGHRWLGGRAFTPPVRDGRIAIDNGPHVMLGVYREFRALLRRLGTEDHFERPRSLRLAYADGRGRRARLALFPGPAPLAFPWAVLAHGLLGVGERLRALAGLAATLAGARPGESLADWCRRRNQNGGPRRVLWDPMTRAIMNAEAEDVDAGLFLATLRQAFLGSGRAAAIWIPREPWGRIVGEPAERALAAAGVEIACGRKAVAIEVDAGRVCGIGFADGSREGLGADDLLVSALPWHAAARLFDGHADLPDAGALPPSPIVSVYFEAENDPGLPPESLVALIDSGPFDFLCRRAGDDPRRYAVLNGGGRGLGGLGSEAIVAAARDQLGRCFPDARGLDTAPARIAKEARATFVAAPGQAGRRPPPGRVPGLANLRLAGDWTATGLPATLEGAALSARLALTD